ncbi:MAG: CGNR zinc finger domain-containing protein [Actinomycetota bacterium]
MDPLPLDPRGYTGTYKLVGGQPSLDLINTLAWPATDREHDWFDPSTNVALWALEVGLIDDETRRGFDRARRDDPDQWASQLRAIRDLRQSLRSAIKPLALGEAPTPQSMDELNRMLAVAARRRRIDHETLQWSWSEPTTLVELMAPVIWNAGEVLTSIDRKRIGLCPTCDWLFHDTTRNRRRRWCDMADCGSRDKALRYYHRQKVGHHGP